MKRCQSVTCGCRSWRALIRFVLPHQESISDFYWYYSGKDVMDEAGQRNFSRALAVAKQVFNSLTEYIQVSQKQNAGSEKDFSFFLFFLIFKTTLCLFPGPMRRQPAESGSQQAVGRCGRVPACLCQHADEVVTGLSLISSKMLVHKLKVRHLFILHYLWIVYLYEKCGSVTTRGHYSLKDGNSQAHHCSAFICSRASC